MSYKFLSYSDGKAQAYREIRDVSKQEAIFFAIAGLVLGAAFYIWPKFVEDHPLEMLPLLLWTSSFGCLSIAYNSYEYYKKFKNLAKMLEGSSGHE